jgi:hypothetical protein
MLQITEILVERIAKLQFGTAMRRERGPPSLRGGEGTPLQPAAASTQQN